MKDKVLVVMTLTLGSVLGMAGLVWWMNLPGPAELKPRLADPAEISSARPANAGSSVDVVNIEGKFRASDGKPMTGVVQTWPCFRGADLDNIVKDSPPLSVNWEQSGPPVLWSVDLGEGYAGPAVLNGRVYLLDYDDTEKADTLKCLSLTDGAEIWRRWYKVVVKRNHGMSRTVPAVTDKHCVTIGPRCHVMCVDAVTGAFKWGMDLVKDHGATEPMWYAGQCPLIDDGIVVLGVGGESLLMGVDCETGAIVWRTPNANKWKMSHACIVPMTFGGRKMYVYCALGGMAGIAADGADRGAVLWETSEWNHSVVAPSPVPLTEGRILVTAGYGVGSAMFQLESKDGKMGIKLLQKIDRKIFACEQHTPIFYEGHLYTVQPADAGPTKRQTVCMTPDCKIVWTSGGSEQFGLGPFIIADGKLFILNDDGLLTAAKATSEGYIKLASAKILTGKESWAPLVFVDGRLLARDYRKMVCLDMRGVPR